MLYNLTCQHIELSDLERGELDKKIDRLARHVTPPYTLDVTLKHDTHHLKGDVISCHMNIEQGKKVFHAERVGNTIADTVDEVLDALKSELEKDHSRRKDRHE